MPNPDTTPPPQNQPPPEAAPSSGLPYDTLRQIVLDLAAWSAKWPRTRVHSARLQDEMNTELYALEDRAKVAAAACSHS